jgi:hypothetical protein
LKKIPKIATIIVFVICALAIVAAFFVPLPWNVKKQITEEQRRIVIPRNYNAKTEEIDNSAERLAQEDNMSAWAGLEEGEVIVSVLTGYFDGGPVETQFIAYRNLLEIEGPIYLTFIDYDQASRSYKRLWSAPTAATRPGTIRLYTQDLLGDRSVCALLSGMNSQGEHTLSVFRLNPNKTESRPFAKIAELRIDGTINVREIERSQAYQSGQSRGQSFAISAFGRDIQSSNFLDQIETVYTYNRENGLYEQNNIIRIPGSQVEQRRVRELLGNSRLFEEFITGLWYHITPQGTIDKRQYIYFNPPSREIIYFGDETQQVFNWQNSASTRYGLYVSSQNISVSTLRRSIDIELESLESIKVRVIEDVRLKIGVNAPWDGSYRKATQLENRAQKPPPANAHLDAWYDGSIGKIRFLKNGSYEINSEAVSTQGKYAFYYLYNEEVLELRPENSSASQREVYLIEGEMNIPPPRKTMTLLRARIGAKGIERLHERPVLLTLLEI